MSALRPRAPPPVGDIVAGLAALSPALARELLPGGSRVGNEWVCPSAASPFGCSVSVHVAPPRAGVWCAWAIGPPEGAGDALDLVAAVHCNGDKAAAIRWARAWLGLDSAGADIRVMAKRAALTPVDDDTEDRERTRRAALRIWLAAEPRFLNGTPAQLYLIRRGIDLTLLEQQPRALRYHPGLWNSESRTEHPALVAAITRNGQTVGVHRTWLTTDGHRAPLAAPKRALGQYRGGVIPLCRGSSGKPLAHAPAGSTVWISEGIEDGLSMALLTGGATRVLAAVSLSNMGSLELPPALTAIAIAGQADPWWADHIGQRHGAARGLERAIRNFQAQGRTVRVWRPPPIPGVKDANDYARWLEDRERERDERTADDLSPVDLSPVRR